MNTMWMCEMFYSYNVIFLLLKNWSIKNRITLIIKYKINEIKFKF